MPTEQQEDRHTQEQPASHHTTNDTTRQATAGGHSGEVKRMLGVDLKALGDFWTKINNDWVLNLSGLLAYNFLMSIFPILLVLLAIAGFILGTVSPGTYSQLQHGIGNALPGGSNLLVGVTRNLAKSAGIVLIVGVVVAVFTGSRLFITIENCFGIVFRLRGRNVIQQNLMAIGMMLIYAVLVPLIFLASILPTAIDNAVFPGGNGGFKAFVIQIIGIVFGFLVAALLFGIIYVVVPNRPVEWKEVWKGTLVAAALFVIYEIVFPIYESIFLKPNNYGSLAGFAVVILVFFYYMAFILLLGAEINSFAAGQRQTAGDLAAVIHEVQAHNTTRGAAGPTAGTTHEDIQNHKGAEAMSTPARAVTHEREDHHHDAQPPKYAEAGTSGAGPAAAQPQTPDSAERTEAAERATQHKHGHDGHDGRDGHHDERGQGGDPQHETRSPTPV